VSRLIKFALLISFASWAGVVQAQQIDAVSKIDVAITYSAERTLKADTSQSVWLQGGSLALGAEFWRGLGIAADVTGLHASSIGSSGVPFSELTVTFGPRYRWHSRHRVSAYAQALVGEANAFQTILPGTGAAQSGTNTLALKMGGGLDYSLSPKFALRVFDASWNRTQFGNSTDNLQNDLRLSTGVVVKFGH
jgi:hypothetical protein